MKNNSTKTYEEAYSELEDVVKKLEKGELTLEESISNFQKGIELTGFLNKKLDEAERKITILVENGEGEVAEQPFPELGQD